MAKDREQQKQFRRLYRVTKEFTNGMGLSMPAFNVALVIFAAFMVGANEIAIQELTGFSAEFIGRVAKRMRKDFIWRKNVVRAQWLDKETDVGFVSLLCDILTGTGEIHRVPNPEITKRNKLARAKRIKDGKCSNCGGDRDTEKRICSKCRESSRQSAARRHAPTVIERAVLKPIPQSWYFMDAEQRKKANQEIGK